MKQKSEHQQHQRHQQFILPVTSDNKYTVDNNSKTENEGNDINYSTIETIPEN